MTASTEHVQITEEHVGRVYVEHYEAYDLMRIQRPPEPRFDRYVIMAVAPADPHYYVTCPSAGPRVEVTLSKIRRGEEKVDTVERFERMKAEGRKVGQLRWLPTTGNERVSELEL